MCRVIVDHLHRSDDMMMGRHEDIRHCFLNVLLVSYTNLSGERSAGVLGGGGGVVMISPGPLPACPVWSLPHGKYASRPQKIYHRDLTRPALTLQ